MRIRLSTIELTSLAVVGAFAICVWALSAAAGNPLLAALIALSCLVGGGIVASRSNRWLLSSAATLLLLSAVMTTYYYVIVPDVIFKINARAFPGHVVVEFREGCPTGIRGTLRRRVEYVVSASGYGCSSTQLPAEWYRRSLVFYDDDPSLTREPPLLAREAFLATSALICSGSTRPYVHVDLATPGGSSETWHDFVERVNFKCGVEPANIAVQRTGTRDARPGR